MSSNLAREVKLFAPSVRVSCSCFLFFAFTWAQLLVALLCAFTLALSLRWCSHNVFVKYFNKRIPRYPATVKQIGERWACFLRGLSVHTFSHLGIAALLMVKLARLSAVLVVLGEDINTQSHIVYCDKCMINTSGHLCNKILSHNKTCIHVLHEEMCNNGPLLETSD